MKADIARRSVLRVAASGSAVREDDSVAVEEPLEIRVAQDPVAITMRTPGDDARLAVGFLFGEGILESVEDVGSLFHCGRPGDEGYGNAFEVTPASGAKLDTDALLGARRGTLTTAACGVCGRQTVDDLFARAGKVPAADPVPVAVVANATARLRDAQRVFSQTGGTHAAAALDARGHVLAAFEDVGRHNAVDKVVGELVLSRRIRTRGPDAPAILAVSGRASFEIIQKAAMAHLPVVASVSAASSLAIDLAQRCDIALATFVRGERFNIFTHPERLLGVQESPVP